MMKKTAITLFLIFLASPAFAFIDRITLDETGIFINNYSLQSILYVVFAAILSITILIFSYDHILPIWRHQQALSELAAEAARENEWAESRRSFDREDAQMDNVAAGVISSGGENADDYSDDHTGGDLSPQQALQESEGGWHDVQDHNRRTGQPWSSTPYNRPEAPVPDLPDYGAYMFFGSPDNKQTAGLSSMDKGKPANSVGKSFSHEFFNYSEDGTSVRHEDNYPEPEDRRLRDDASPFSLDSGREDIGDDYDDIERSPDTSLDAHQALTESDNTWDDLQDYKRRTGQPWSQTPYLRPEQPLTPLIEDDRAIPAPYSPGQRSDSSQFKYQTTWEMSTDDYSAASPQHHHEVWSYASSSDGHSPRSDYDELWTGDTEELKESDYR